MSIGGVSFANNGYNARVNQQRRQNMANGQDQFQTPEFFRADFTRPLVPSIQPGQKLLAFGSREAVANAEVLRQRHLQGQDSTRVDTARGVPTSQPSISQAPIQQMPIQARLPPQGPLIQEVTPQSSTIEVVPTPTPSTPRIAQGPAPVPVHPVLPVRAQPAATQTSPPVAAQLPANVLRTMETSKA